MIIALSRSLIQQVQVRRRFTHWVHADQTAIRDEECLSIIYSAVVFVGKSSTWVSFKSLLFATAIFPYFPEWKERQFLTSLPTSQLHMRVLLVNVIVNSSVCSVLLLQSILASEHSTHTSFFLDERKSFSFLCLTFAFFKRLIIIFRTLKLKESNQSSLGKETSCFPAKDAVCFLQLFTLVCCILLFLIDFITYVSLGSGYRVSTDSWRISLLQDSMVSRLVSNHDSAWIEENDDHHRQDYGSRN